MLDNRYFMEVIKVDTYIILAIIFINIKEFIIIIHSINFDLYFIIFNFTNFLTMYLKIIMSLFFLLSCLIILLINL